MVLTLLPIYLPTHQITLSHLHIYWYKISNQLFNQLPSDGI